ncbi:MAG: succinate--CoA ligase subunit alpha [Candidatus Asgardarchaeia archaeon]
MAILINNNSKVIIQGITGRIGRRFASRMHRGQTKLIGGVTPGKGGEKVSGVPVYNTVRECMKYGKPDISLIVVPPTRVIDAVLESVDEGINIIVIYTDNVPIHDTIKFLNYAANNNVIVVGPGAAGIVTPNQCNVSEVYDSLIKPGRVGVVAKSGSLCNEVLNFMNNLGIGQSTICCLGGGLLIGLRMKEVIEYFSKDPETSMIILLGEVGGTDELDALESIKHCEKPIIGYISGFFAPPGIRMGHAGAILGENKDSARYKSEMLSSAGVVTTRTILELFTFLTQKRYVTVF